MITIFNDVQPIPFLNKKTEIVVTNKELLNGKYANSFKKVYFNTNKTINIKQQKTYYLHNLKEGFLCSNKN